LIENLVSVEIEFCKKSNDFWSFMIFWLNIEKDENTYNQFARLYNILIDSGEVPSADFAIKLNESIDSFYIQILNPPFEILKTVVAKWKQFNLEYTIFDNSIYFEVEKKQKELKKEFKSNKNSKRSITQDDLSELVNMIEKFQAYNYQIHFDIFSLDELHSFKSVFSNYANTLSQYET